MAMLHAKRFSNTCPLSADNKVDFTISFIEKSKGFCRYPYKACVEFVGNLINA